MEQELLTLPEHLSSPPVFSGVRVSRSFVLYVHLYVLLIVVCPFILFLLAIVLSVLRYTDSDCPFGIFKLFLKAINTYFKVFGFTRLKIDPI